MTKILQEPFTQDCQWWAPIELIKRLLLIVFIIFDAGNLVSYWNYEILSPLTHTYVVYFNTYTYLSC